MNIFQECVLKFHQKFNKYIAKYPSIPNDKNKKLRKDLIEEEIGELLEAIENDDLVKIADAFADSLYVIHGIKCSYGIDIEPIFEIVHKNNMSKEDTGIEHVKVQKGKDWVDPKEKIKEELVRQGAEL